MKYLRVAFIANTLKIVHFFAAKITITVLVKLDNDKANLSTNVWKRINFSSRAFQQLKGMHFYTSTKKYKHPDIELVSIATKLQ